MMNGSFGLSEAIRIAGGKSALADKLGVRPQSVGKWRRIPYNRIIQVEKLIGISREILCPELYGKK